MFQYHRYAEKVVGNRIVYHLLVKPQKQLVTSLLLVLAILAVHFHANSEQIFCNPSIVQGGFFNWSALKMTKCQITCKSLQKSSKCQIFQWVRHLVIFRADQLKKPPCTISLGLMLFDLKEIIVVYFHTVFYMILFVGVIVKIVVFKAMLYLWLFMIIMFVCGIGFVSVADPLKIVSWPLNFTRLS